MEQDQLTMNLNNQISDKWSYSIFYEHFRLPEKICLFILIDDNKL